MAFNFNGNTPSQIIYNGNTVTTLVYNGVTVWVAFTSKEFAYTGGVQEFIVPITGTYKLEVWGASGGTAIDDSFDHGGLGGYATGTIELAQGQTIYIVVGEKGYYNGYPNLGDYIYESTHYNGGGKITSYSGGGGGATHIATTNRGELKNYVNNKSEVMIVAGGGGGNGYRLAKGGSGGGTEGGQGLDENQETYGGLGGTQSAPTRTLSVSGGFGYGGTLNGNDAYTYLGGGGSGWYGGEAGHSSYKAGSGGSGYVGGVSNGSMENGIKTGHGKAKITLL